mmetsp:Transcript_12862/g.39751  ORF Transcript_12862/g.39751 Transcript_12862/m.39751 type:complete len:278 (-) Transcript_12862:1-834(-)
MALVRHVVIDTGKLGELRVHRIDVVEIDKVLSNELPITLDVVVLHPVELHILQIVALQLAGEVAKYVCEWRRIGLLVQKDHAGKGLEPRHADQAQVLLAFPRRGHRGRRLERAVEAVGPPVVGAHQLLAVLGVGGAHFGASVPADVVEGVKLHLLVASHDDGGASYVQHLDIPRLGELGRVRGCEPLGAEDALLLRTGVGLVDVERGVQRLGLLDGSDGRARELLQGGRHGRQRTRGQSSGAPAQGAASQRLPGWPDQAGKHGSRWGPEANPVLIQA